MTLADLIAAPVATQRAYWLTMTESQRDTLLATQSTHGTDHGQVGIVALQDNRYGICADQLSMIYPGGWFTPIWTALPDDWKASIQITDTPAFLPTEEEA